MEIDSDMGEGESFGKNGLPNQHYFFPCSHTLLVLLLLLQIDNFVCITKNTSIERPKAKL
jgi:hypothetical protein